MVLGTATFATLLVAVLVQLSAWPMWVNLTAAMVLVFVVLLTGFVAGQVR